MKENYTKFSCDVCSKEKTIVHNSGFPYNEGWCYIYNIQGKVRNTNNQTIPIQEKDLHFCSKACMLQFFENISTVSMNEEEVDKIE